ncbi:MAG TPA: DoxX family protein [Polyangiaceae bacterium]|nr:DoxX family protein [Polyangiaceae bacterium]
MAAMNEKYLPLVARLVLGAIFLVFGLNGFLGYLPPPEMPDRAEHFMGALAATGYMFPLVKSVELVAGVMLLAGRYVPLAVVLLAPGIVNIVLFHAILAPGGLDVALGVLVLELYVAWSYRDVYRPMLTARAVPTARKPPEQRFHREVTASAHG